MPFLGFIGTPPTPIPYSVFNQLATGTGFGASTLRAGAEAAKFAIPRAASWVVGAGTLGFFIGQKILENLEYTGPDIPIRQQYRAPGGQGILRVNTRYQLVNGVPQFRSVEGESPAVAPVSQPVDGQVFRNGVLFGAGESFTPIITAAPDLFISPLEVISVEKVGGGTVNFQKSPVPALPIVPYQPIRLPTTVPVQPGQPDFPITPTVIPAPENDPDEDNKNGEPGVIVQIPEVGIQLKFTPTGVSVGAYKAPGTSTSTQPKIPPPPLTPPPARDVCPCPESEDKSAEIICRIKKLQEDLLDDGYEYTSRGQNVGPGANVDGLPDELYGVEVTVTDSVQPIKKERPSGTSDTVWYAGWFYFRRNGRNLSRTPISFAGNFFVAPEGADGYGVSIAYGGTAICSAITRVKKQYVDNC